MLSFPTIPTDSLYKFLFVAGIILTVSACYLESKVVDKHENDTYKLDSLKIFATIERDKINDSIKTSEKIINDYYSHLKSIKKQTDDLSAISKGKTALYHHKLDSLKTVWLKIAKEENLIEKNFIIAKSELSKLKLTETKLLLVKFKQELNALNSKEDNKYFYNLLVYGLFLTITGGALWYHKIQIIQDAMLKLQASKLEEELKKARAYGRKHFEPFILPKKIKDKL